MDTRMLDVAIGLVLVFALTSLLVTAWQEALASWKNSRGVNLHKAIASLLGDDAAFADRLLDHPLLKSLAMERADQSQRLPSYISGDVFVSALLAQLTSDYTGGLRPATPADLVAHLQQKLPPAQQPFGRSLAALALGAEADWAAYETRLIAWFNAVGERSIGWFKRGTQLQMFLAGLVVAAAMNINPILITSALWTDAALRKSAVAQAEVALDAYQAQSAQSKGASGGGQPAAPAQPAIPVTVAEQERKLGLAQLALHGWVDRLSELSRPDAGQVPDQAIDLLRSSYELGAILESGKPSQVPHLMQRLSSLQARIQGSALKAEPALLSQLAMLTNAVEALQMPADVAASAAVPAQGPCLKISDPAARELCAKQELLKGLELLGLPLGWQQAGLPTVLPTHCNRGTNLAETAKPSRCALGEQMSEAAWWGNLLLALLGWMATALAVTLGAPFWFDLLGKLVKLRGAGGKPDAQNPAGSAGSAPSTLASTPAAPSGEASVGNTSKQVPRGSDAGMNDAMNDAEKALTPIEIGTVQKRIQMDAAEISMRFDINTRDAIKAWQTQAFGQGNGILSAQQIALLLSGNFDDQDDGYFA